MAAEAGLKPFEVDAMDLVDVLIQVEGHEMRERNELIRMRYLAYTIHAHSMAKHKAKSPEKFMPLYWEKNSGMPGRTPEQLREWYEQRREEIKKINSRRNGS